MRQKQRAGEFIGAFCQLRIPKSPSDKNRLLIDPYAAGIVRRIFQMFLQGMGKQTIARTLNREGILCPANIRRFPARITETETVPGEGPAGPILRLTVSFTKRFMPEIWCREPGISR